MANGIDLVRAEHERVRELFGRFNATLDWSLVGQTLGALRARDDVEHAPLYALAARLVDDPALMDRLAAAHSAVKKQIEVVAALEGTRLVDAFQTLQAFVGDHARVEETKLLPRLAEHATAEQLEGLGAQILEGKQRVGP
ncbi:MAG: hemerythrin domain-containing protein [Actinomycetia bacterium]|nr:hemerythrin domain-containing protein [Actinomycetes bacterium]